EGLYTPEMGRRTYAEALRLSGELLRAGWPVIIDGAFSHAAERAEARAMASQHGVPFAILWCDAPDEELVHRLRRRSADRHERSAGREALLGPHRAGYEAPDAEANVIRLDTSGDGARAAEAALAAIEASRR